MNVIVIGIGNILFSDEGVGVYASKYIEENFDYSDHLTIIDGGTLGFKLMTYYQEYDKVIILDTVSIKDTIGSIYNLPSDELLNLGTYRQTAHEVEVVEMLEICSMLDTMAEVKIIGIVPKDIESVKIDMTDELKTHFDNYIKEIIKEIRDSDVTITSKDNIIPLDTIIKEYANPSSLEVK